MSELAPPTTSVLGARAVLALLFAAARYVPLPIVDDLVRERIARALVARAASASGHALDPAEIAVLGASSDGCLGCLAAIVRVPLFLILYPIRTLLSIVLGVRWASRDLVEMFALGRTIDRLLADGRYPRDATMEARLAYARDVRRSFDLARRGLDVHAVQGLLSVALGPLRSIVPAMMRPLRRFWHGEDPARGPEAEAPASRLTAALEDPRMRELLITIDRRFDEALSAERARSAGA
jgi:hypothetical protein